MNSSYISPFAKPVYIMLKPVGSVCNLACEYCYYLEKSKFYPDVKNHIMTDQILEKFIKEYMECQTMQEVLFTWHGGETLMRPISFYKKALELQRKYAGGRQIDNCIQTNGTLLNDEWCQFFKENNFLVGVSIDGPQEFHDEYRRNRQGLPSFYKVMKGIELLKKHGVEYNAMAVVNDYNVDYPLEFYNFFKELDCRFIQFAPIVERIGRHKEGTKLSSPEEQDAAIELAPFSVDSEKWGDFLCALFDGGWDKKPEEWQLPRIYSHIKKLQPTCAVGVNHTIVLKEGERKFALPDSMIVDNKYTFQYFPSDFRLWDPKIAHKADKKQYLHQGKSYYLPFEHTLCLSKAWNWFQKSSIMPVRDLDELEELFYWCTDNDNTLVVNIPPDQTGRIREHEANTIIGLNKRLGIKKGKPLPRNGKFISLNSNVTASSTYGNDEDKYGAQFATDGGMQTRWAAADTVATLSLTLDEKEPFNKISIFEYCDVKNGADGFSNYRTNRIKDYQIEIWKDGEWETIYRSDVPMGDCKVIHFPYSYRTSQIRLNILKASAPPSIYEFNVIYK